jgi:hypothetical protein
MSEERAASVFILKMEAAQLKSSGSSSPIYQAETMRAIVMWQCFAMRVRKESLCFE